MAKEIDKIIQSKTAPKSNNVLWDDGENLKINRNGKWETVVPPLSDKELDEILYGSSYYYYNDEGIGTWDISVEEESENEISS
jgi:hypothetical protein